MVPSTNSAGHRPFKAETLDSNPAGTTNMGECSESGQKERTVNPLLQGYVGSNPTSSTTLSEFTLNSG